MQTICLKKQNKTEKSSHSQALLAMEKKKEKEIYYTELEVKDQNLPWFHYLN